MKMKGQVGHFFLLAVLGLRFCARVSSSCGKRGPLFIAVRGPLRYRGLSLRSTGSRRAGSVVVTHGPSCSAACGIFPDHGSNPCPLHWQADSQPLRHQGSPSRAFLIWCSGNGTCKTCANFVNGCSVLRFLNTTSEVYPKDSS